ncbi:hypothetical protein RsoM2USA_445 [Ralstonia phage RsoM2USA]|nr:hypothetical protein RsoM2USA_445 [Ralstonia phage RsoM2USA]
MTYKVSDDAGYVKCLASLCAKENIRVIVNSAMSAPAAFDLLSRDLYLSEKHEDEELTPGFTFHEVGHALFTNITKHQLNEIQPFFTIFNIVEDGYIERKLCRAYPGVKKYLKQYFQKLFVGRDFTSIELVTWIVNVLNYNCKGGKYAKTLPYPPQVQLPDLKLLRDAENLSSDSIRDRIRMAELINEMLKKYSVKVSIPAPSIVSSESDEESDEHLDGDGESDDKEMKSSNANGKKEEGKTDKSGNAQKPENSPGSGCCPQDILENDDQFFDHHDVMKGSDPEKNDVVYSVLDEALLRKCSSFTDIKKVSFVGSDSGHTTDQIFKKVKTEATKVSNRIYHTFMVRKSAANRANTKNVNSGDVDVAKIPYYQIDDDIFEIKKIRPNQQNHTYAIALDWSGSMMGCTRSLFCRTAEIALFCRKAKIEAEIFLYTTASGIVSGFIGTPMSAINPSKFLPILNTKDSDFDNKLYKFWKLCVNHRTSASFFQFEGTNVTEGFLYAHQILKSKRAAVKKCLILTDGGDEPFFRAKFGKDGRVSAYSSFAGADVIFKQSKIASVDKETGDYLNVRLEVLKQGAKYFKFAYGHDTIAITWNLQKGLYDDIFDNVVDCEGSDDLTLDYQHAPNEILTEIIQGLI